jgi:hypothetical protein
MFRLHPAHAVVPGHSVIRVAIERQSELAVENTPIIVFLCAYKFNDTSSHSYLCSNAK